MKQRLFSRRSCSLGASSILAVAAVGFAATPAFAGTPQTAASVHGQQNSRTHSARVNLHPSFLIIGKLSDPRMG
jgi:hypothetical protein